MKKLTMLTSCLALAACFGGGGNGITAGPGRVERSSTPTAVRNANAAVTSMETFIDNSDETVGAVRSAGISLPSGSGVRSAVHRSATTTAQTFAGNNTPVGYDEAVGYFQKLDTILGDISGDYTTQEVADAYKLAHSLINSSAASTDVESEQLTFLDTNRAAITTRIDSFFNKDGGGDYIWAPKVTTLENVQFKIPSGEGLANQYFSFGLGDDGTITTLTPTVGGPTGGTIARENDNSSARFNGVVYEYVKDGSTKLRVVLPDDHNTWEKLVEYQGGLTGGRWDRMDQTWEVHTFGKENHLAYSDFGYFKSANRSKVKQLDEDRFGDANSDLASLVAADNDTNKSRIMSDAAVNDELQNSQDYIVFAGGYNDKKITPTRTMAFSGKAFGKIYASIHADSHKDDYMDLYNMPANSDGDNARVLSTNNATLVFTNGATPEEKLTMDFSNSGWYNVEVIKSGETQTINFKGTPSATFGGANYNGLYEFNNAGTAKTITGSNGEVNFGYYGVTSPSESVGTVAFRETVALTPLVGEEHVADNPTRELQFEAAYGAKR